MLAFSSLLLAAPVSAATFPDQGAPNGGTSQGVVTQFRSGTAYTDTNVPVSSTNPLPTTATLSGATVIGVKGADGSTISSTTNQLPVEAVPSNAASVAITPCVTQGVSTLQCGTAAAKNGYVFYLTATADSWLMIFNSTTAPTNGATTAGVASGNLEDCVKVPTGTTTSIGGLSIPKRYSAGVYMAISSTACSTLTLATTGLLSGMVQ